MVETAPLPKPKNPREIWIKRQHKPTLTHEEYEEEWKAKASSELSDSSSDEIDDDERALEKAAIKKVVREMNSCSSNLADFAPLFDSWKSGSENPLFFNLSNVFWRAIAKNHIDTVLYMLQGGYPISRWEVRHTARLHRFELLEQIFDGGWWNINQMQCILWPPILSSVVEDEVCVRWLLEHGADPNARCEINLTALSDAVRFAPLSTIEFLLDHGGDVAKGELLHHALLRDDKVLETATLLLDRGAPINRNMYEDDEQGFLRCGIMSVTPLHSAASKGMVDVVKLLLERGADIHKLDGLGLLTESGEAFTALEHAARAQSWDTYAILAPEYRLCVSLEN